MVNTEPDNYVRSYRALFGLLVMSPSYYLSRLFNQCENNVIITPTIIGAISATNREELGKQMVETIRMKSNKKISKIPSNDQYESFRTRTSIKIHRDFKPLFDELVAEERENRIDFMDILLVFYAQEKYPDILESFKKQELKTQKKLDKETNS